MRGLENSRRFMSAMVAAGAAACSAYAERAEAGTTPLRHADRASVTARVCYTCAGLSP